MVEYARINRLFQPDMFNTESSDFADDLFATFEAGLTRVGRWWSNEWHLGDLERDLTDGVTVGITGRLGWFGETESSDVPPPYDPQSHSWLDQPSTVREGALGLFYVDIDSQVLSITSAAGDLKVPGFCRAMQDILSQAEMDRQYADAGVRAPREWVVTPVDERGTFEAWMDRVEVVTKVRASFHIPNPRVDDDIAPAVEYLADLGAERGTVSAESSSPGGLTPLNNPLVKAGIEMQRLDYGSVTAEGETEDRQVDKFNSREHPVHDRHDFEGVRIPTIPEMFGVLRGAVRQRLERGLR